MITHAHRLMDVSLHSARGVFNKWGGLEVLLTMAISIRQITSYNISISLKVIIERLVYFPFNLPLLPVHYLIIMIDFPMIKCKKLI